MKNIIILLILLFSLSGFDLSEKHTGIYEKKEKQSTGAILEIFLELKSNGTFYCTFYQDQLCYKEYEKGKGKWVVEKGEILFSAEQKVDVNEEYILDFDGTKAEIIGNKLIFKKSKMVWPQFSPLIKNE